MARYIFQLLPVLFSEGGTDGNEILIFFSLREQKKLVVQVLYIIFPLKHVKSREQATGFPCLQSIAVTYLGQSKFANSGAILVRSLFRSSHCVFGYGS